MTSLIGIDEVGRGCWAGPLVAGAVRLHIPIEGLEDSKRLSKARRETLAAEIYATADTGLGWVTPVEVDEQGLTAAVRLAMQRAYEALGVEAESVIIDGNYNYLPDVTGASAVVKADGSIPAVSAASIIAKVARDTYMQTLGEAYERWGFASHVGYGTKAHRTALDAHGVSDLHRKSYKPIQKYL